MRIFHWTAAIGMAVFCQTAALAESRMETSSKGLTADDEVEVDAIQTNAFGPAFYSIGEGNEEEDASLLEPTRRGFDEYVSEKSGSLQLKMGK